MTKTAAADIAIGSAVALIGFTALIAAGVALIRPAGEFLTFLGF